MELVKEVDVAALVLVFGLLWILLVLRIARAGGFNWTTAFQDDNGKSSVLRIGVLVCLIISSWLLMYLALHVVQNDKTLQELFPYFMAYLAVWSGAKVVEKMLDVIMAKYGVKAP